MEYQTQHKQQVLPYIAKLGKAVLIPAALALALYGCGKEIPTQSKASESLRPSQSVLRPTDSVSGNCFYQNPENPNIVYLASQGENGRVMRGAALDTTTIGEAQRQGIERCLE